MRKHYHFIGIGGTGLSAIARVLHEQGQFITGSDLIISPLAEELQELGIQVYEGHKAEQISNPNIVIRSSAISDDNVEVVAANQKDIPVLKRIDFLKEMTDTYKLAAVAGTHGKTTTTAMTAWVFDQLGLDPSYIIGGTSKNLRSNAHAGKSEHFVIEADEYDYMFLGLQPSYLIITNIEHDHPDCYPTQEEYVQAFKDLVNCTREDSILIICFDDPIAKQIGDWARTKRSVVMYGKSEEADYRIVDTQNIAQKGIRFELIKPDGSKAEQTLSLPGEHNALNASAVLALVDQLGLDQTIASTALEEFSGTGRRFDILGVFDGITLIDDYGHHPTEIRSTTQATRAKYPTNRIFTVWQPHTYSRTQELFDEFLTAFIESDVVIVTEIYASREKKQDYSSKLVADKIQNENVHFIAGLDETANFLLNELRSDDVVVVLSAGDANEINQQLAKELAARTVERGKHE